jgi:hypothetical protein
MAQPAGDGILSGFRVLDLADDKGLLCTKFFADLGACSLCQGPAHGPPRLVRHSSQTEVPARTR